MISDIEFINSVQVKDSINKLSNNIRAEKNSSESYLRIFADPTIIDRLKNRNNQIVYGRRGSGKTHLLLALAEKIEEENTEDNKIIPIYIDLREILPLLTEEDTSKIEASVLIFQHIINIIIATLADNIKYIFDIGDIYNESTFEKSKKHQISIALESLNYAIEGNTISRLGEISFSKEEVNKISGSLQASKNPSLTANAENENKSTHSSANIKYISFGDISKSLTQLMQNLNDVKVLLLFTWITDIYLKLIK